MKTKALRSFVENLLTLVKLGLGPSAGQVLLFCDAFDDPLYPGYLPPDALCRACRAAN
jgi:hypothetical protein